MFSIQLQLSFWKMPDGCIIIELPPYSTMMSDYLFEWGCERAFVAAVTPNCRTVNCQIGGKLLFCFCVSFPPSGELGVWEQKQSIVLELRMRWNNRSLSVEQAEGNVWADRGCGRLAHSEQPISPEAAEALITRMLLQEWQLIRLLFNLLTICHI